jgi:hypothetical protein
VSRCLTNKKDVSKKSNVPKFVMTMTVKDAYCKFKKKYPNTKIGFTAFFHFKLKEVVKKSLRNKQKVLYVSDMLQCCLKMWGCKQFLSRNKLGRLLIKLVLFSFCRSQLLPQTVPMTDCFILFDSVGANYCPKQYQWQTVLFCLILWEPTIAPNSTNDRLFYSFDDC